jgi:hypothetical protein
MLAHMLKHAKVARQKSSAFDHWKQVTDEHVAQRRKAVQILQALTNASAEQHARLLLLFWRRWTTYRATERARVSPTY